MGYLPRGAEIIVKGSPTPEVFDMSVESCAAKGFVVMRAVVFPSGNVQDANFDANYLHGQGALEGGVAYIKETPKGEMETLCIAGSAENLQVPQLLAPLHGIAKGMGAMAVSKEADLGIGESPEMREVVSRVFPGDLLTEMPSSDRGGVLVDLVTQGIGQAFFEPGGWNCIIQPGDAVVRTAATGYDIENQSPAIIDGKRMQIVTAHFS